MTLRGSASSTWKRRLSSDDPNTARYFTAVGKEEILDAQAERRLFQRYKKKGDIQARDRILGSALRFVIKLAKNYSRDADTTKDLISAGNLGLLKAVERYELGHNTRFLTYATSWVLLEMRNELYNAGIVSMPLWRQKALGKLKQANARSQAKNGKRATLNELGSVVDLSPVQLERLQECQGVCIVAMQDCDEYPSNGTGPRAADRIAVSGESRTVLAILIRMLPSVKEQFVIKAYFGWISDPMSLRQIASVLGVSSERVRQIKTDALRRLCRQLRYRLRVNHVDDLWN